jgi:hypothetical protein
VYIPVEARCIYHLKPTEGLHNRKQRGRFAGPKDTIIADDLKKSGRKLTVGTLKLNLD